MHNIALLIERSVPPNKQASKSLLFLAKYGGCGIFFETPLDGMRGSVVCESYCAHQHDTAASDALRPIGHCDRFRCSDDDDVDRMLLFIFSGNTVLRGNVVAAKL